ncbi:MAG TPA: SDR family NAD(P)-dependent oxidoreductase [Longimicrobiales bacterium]
MNARAGIRTAGGVAAGAAAYLAWRALRARNEISLDGRVALITGGSRGLGLLLAREFARNGCRVAICARAEQELERAHRDLEARGTDTLAIVCDVSDRDAVQRMVDRVIDHFDTLDILVNNAGIIQVGPIETMTIEDFEEIMAINFWGAVYATLAVLPHMRARAEGRIVNITSIGAKVAVPHLLPYDCAKFALRGFSEGLRAELAEDGIVVTTIVPGLMRTGSPVNALFKGQRAREFTWFSLGDALPFTSMNAERAARRIALATRRGEGEVTLSWQARLLGLVHDLFPGTTADLLGLVNRALPDAGPANGTSTRGIRLSTPLAPSPLTALMNRAARDYNQLGGASSLSAAREAAREAARAPHHLPPRERSPSETRPPTS